MKQEGSTPLDNSKHEEFAKAWAGGKNLTEAALAAGYSESRARKTGSELGTKRDIQARKEWLQKAAADKFILTRETWLLRLDKIARKAEDEGDFAAAKGCLREIGLAMPDFYTPTKIEAAVEIIIRIGQ